MHNNNVGIMRENSNTIKRNIISLLMIRKIFTYVQLHYRFDIMAY